MIIRPPSSQKSWDTYCSKDSAFKQPPKPPGDDATEDERNEYIVTIEKYQATLKACQETGDWSPLLVEGGQPTKFILSPINGNVWRALIDRTVISQASPRFVGPVMTRTILFRLALKGINGWDKIERSPDPEWDGWVMAPADVVAQLDAIDPAIVGEIGQLVLDRLRGDRSFA